MADASGARATASTVLISMTSANDIGRLACAPATDVAKSAGKKQGDAESDHEVAGSSDGVMVTEQAEKLWQPPRR